MRERPLPMTTLNTYRILNDIKTETRRCIQHQPIIDTESGYVFSGNHKEFYKNDIFHEPWQKQFIKDWCKYQVGDHLYVKETYAKVLNQDTSPYDFKYWYAADFINPSTGTVSKPDSAYFNKWTGGMLFPKKAARIWLEVTDIQIELLHDISEASILAEGVTLTVNSETNSILWCLSNKHNAISFMPKGSLLQDNRQKYTEFDVLFAHWAELWCSINTLESWQSNPFVWVIKFKRISK